MIIKRNYSLKIKRSKIDIASDAAGDKVVEMIKKKV